MNILELYNFAVWVTDEVKGLHTPYQALNTALQHNASQPNKQPIEEPLNNLISLLREMNLRVLTNDQLRLLDEFGIRGLVGREGGNFLNSTIRKAEFDPATAHSDVNTALEALNSASQRAESIRNALHDLPGATEKLGVEKARLLIRVEFRGEASMSDVVDWKNWSATWYDIVRGVALAAGETPNDIRVVGASQGSVIMALSATATFVGLLALISKSVSSIAKDLLTVQGIYEDVKTKKMLNKELEEGFKKRKDDIEAEGFDRILKAVDEKLKPNKLSKENRGHLEKSITKSLEFYKKGGDVDFVDPPDLAADEAISEQQLAELEDARLEIAALRDEREQVKLLEDQRDEDEQDD